MKQGDKEYLVALARQLDNARRLGAPEDVPEGARYIMVSDTSTQEIAERLRLIVAAETED